MKNGGVAAIILAAGASRRFGRPKQLVEYRGEPLLARAVRIAGEAGLQPVGVVLGANRAAIRAALTPGAAMLIENEQWQEGIASSMRAGLDALENIVPGTSGVLMMPCDQPRLTAEHLGNLRQAFLRSEETAIVASVYAAVRGVPAIFPRAVWPQLRVLTGDTGARKLLANPPCAVTEVDFPGGEIDIDAPEDLASLD